MSKHISQSKQRQRAARRALKQSMVQCRGCSKPVRGDHFPHHAPVCTGDRRAAAAQLEALMPPKRQQSA